MKLFDHFSRITSGRPLIPQIDGLRFVAILAVIAFHVRAICSYHFRASPEGLCIEGDAVNDLFGIGHYGVELFFVVSGFILSLPFARQWLRGGDKISLRQYYIRRLTRIEPPYIIHLIFLFALCALVLRWLPAQPRLYENPAWADYSLKHILASLVYANGFIYGNHPYPNIVLWSLEIEVQFYLLAPFLTLIFKIASLGIRRGVIATLIVTGPISVGLIFPDTYRIGFSLLGSFQYFLIGFLLADIYLQNQAPRTGYRWDLILPAALIIVVCFRHSSFLFPFLPWLMFLCGLAAFRGIFTSKFLGWRLITVTGGMCYTIYMYHWLMISALVRITGRLQTHILWLDLMIQFVLMSAIITIVCAILFALFERPFMRRDWPNRLWKKISNPTN